MFSWILHQLVISKLISLSHRIAAFSAFHAHAFSKNSRQSCTCTLHRSWHEVNWSACRWVFHKREMVFMMCHRLSRYKHWKMKKFLFDQLHRLFIPHRRIGLRHPIKILNACFAAASSLIFWKLVVALDKRSHAGQLIFLIMVTWNVIPQLLDFRHSTASLFLFVSLTASRVKTTCWESHRINNHNRTSNALVVICRFRRATYTCETCFTCALYHCYRIS